MSEFKVVNTILALTNIAPQKEDESLRDFKIRLIFAADSLSDDDWSSLNDETIKWVEEGISRIKAANGAVEEVEDFPEFSEELAPIKEDATVAEILKTAEESRPVKTRQRHKPAMERKPNQGAQWHMKIEIAKNPNISHQQLQSLMKEMGFEVTKSTTYGLLSNMRQTMKVLQDLGMLVPYKTEE